MINAVREFLKRGFKRDEATTLALELCINQGILKSHLSKKGSEVFNMLLKEYKEKAMRVAKEERIEQVVVALFDVLDIETIVKKQV